MNKIIIKKCENNFSYIRYFIFTYIKKYSVYEKYIEEDIFYLPYKKRLNKAYLKALVEFLKKKNISVFLSFDKLDATWFDTSSFSGTFFSYLSLKIKYVLIPLIKTHNISMYQKVLNK